MVPYHDVRHGSGEVVGIFERGLAPQTEPILSERESFGHVLARPRRDTDAGNAAGVWRKGGAVDHERLAVPPADRMTEQRRLGVRRMVGPIEMDRPHGFYASGVEADEKPPLRDRDLAH